MILLTCFHIEKYLYFGDAGRFLDFFTKYNKNNSKFSFFEFNMIVYYHDFVTKITIKCTRLLKLCSEKSFIFNFLCLRLVRALYLKGGFIFKPLRPK